MDKVGIKVFFIKTNPTRKAIRTRNEVNVARILNSHTFISDIKREAAGIIIQAFVLFFFRAQIKKINGIQLGEKRTHLNKVPNLKNYKNRIYFVT